MAEPQQVPSARVRRAASVMSSQFAQCSFQEGFSQSLCYGLVYFKDRMTVEDMKAIALERMIPVFPRLRSKIVLEKGIVYFEELDVDEIPMDYHVSYLTEEKVTAEEARRLLTPFYAKGLDIEAPLWRVFLVPELQDGRSLAVFQIDHTVGDGSGLREIMYGVADPVDEDYIKALMTRPKKRVKGPPMTPVRLGYNYIVGIVDGLTGVLGAHDSPNRLKPEDIYNTSKDRRMAATEAIDLDEVKAVKNSFAGATVNDVAMTVYTLMTRTYLENSGDKVTVDALIRACFPIDMRVPGEKIEHVGNNFSIGNFRLDLHTCNRVELFWKVKEAMDNAKTQPAPMVLKFLADNVLPWLPKRVQVLLGIQQMGKYTGMLSNVMGPPVPITLKNNEIDDVEIYVQAEIGSYFGIFSYNNKLSGTVTLDGSREPFPEKLTKNWKSEFEALMAEVEAEKKKRGVEVLFPEPKTNFLDNPNSIYLVAFVLALALAMYIEMSL